MTEYDTDDEVHSEPVPANLKPVPGQHVHPSQPLLFDVDVEEDAQPSSVPLCLVLNCRSASNKINNLREMLRSICPSLTILSETWERERQRLNVILNINQFKIISYYRKNKSPGGGSAIIYDKNKFRVIDQDISVPQSIEAVWCVLSPLVDNLQSLTVKRIAVCALYVSPKSKVKPETIDHIIETIHSLRAKYDNDINFLISGDFNRLPIDEILDSYGGLKQTISVPNRKNATLQLILTDLHTMYHPPTTLPPLQVDADKKGKDSDHDIMLLAPKTNSKYKIEQVKRIIKTRPMPESQIAKYEKDLINYPWEQVFENKSVNEKAELFHSFLRTQLDHYFPEKVSKLSNLDRKWMSPDLKQLHRRMQREFHRHRKSEKYEKLKSKFKKMKRNAVKAFHSDFVLELKESRTRASGT